MPSDWYPWWQPICAGWGLFFLRVDSNDFTATASHQEDPVQTLEENLQELHVWDSSQGRHIQRLKQIAVTHHVCPHHPPFYCSCLSQWAFHYSYIHIKNPLFSVGSSQQDSFSHCHLTGSYNANMASSCFKDTVFIPSSVPRWSGHVEQNQVSSLRLVDHHLVQLDSCVHPTNIWLVPSWKVRSEWDTIQGKH